MSISYVRKLAAQIAQEGMGDPEWHKPLTDIEYQMRIKCRNSDISIERVKFNDEASQQERPISDDAKKV